GEVLGDDALGGRMSARVGDLVEPLAELLVEIIEIAEAAGQEKVLSNVTEWALHFSLGFGPVRLACLWQGTVVVLANSSRVRLKTMWPASGSSRRKTVRMRS